MTESDVLELKARILDVIDSEQKAKEELNTVREAINELASSVMYLCELEFEDPDNITTHLLIEKLKEKFNYQEHQQDIEE